MVIEPLPNANAAAKCLLKNPQRVKKSTEKVGPFETLVNLRLRRWDTSSGASVLLRYDLYSYLTHILKPFQQFFFNMAVDSGRHQSLGLPTPFAPLDLLLEGHQLLAALKPQFTHAYKVLRNFDQPRKKSKEILSFLAALEPQFMHAYKVLRNFDQPRNKYQ